MENEPIFERGSGILMHISSIPSKYGIGTFGREAYKFVDFLRSAGQKYWQILPLSPIDGCGSAYKPYSTFAGNLYFIDLDMLKEEGILKEEDYVNIDWGDGNLLDFDKVITNRRKVLKIAYDNWKTGKEKEIEAYEKENYWVKYYACFMVILEDNDYGNFWEWKNANFKYLNGESLVEFEKQRKDDINFWIFTQIKFYEQWFKLKDYANKKGIKIIGDVSFYVSENSSDVWEAPENFSLNLDLSPRLIGGCPPDAFAIDGQRWGTPTYNWEKLKDSGYLWWKERLKEAFKTYDIVRLDHFRGFDEYYEIDAKEKTARNGVWVKGPGIELFKSLEKSLGNLNVIAEDLGFLTDSVKELIKTTNFPGMKILEFAFNENEEEKNAYLPENYIENSVAYIGTHDNDTAIGWYNNLDFKTKQFCKKTLNITDDKEINWKLIETLMKSKSNLVIFQMQDVLGLDSNTRMNVPGTVGGNNWRWRMKNFDVCKDFTHKLYELTSKYNRL